MFRFTSLVVATLAAALLTSPSRPAARAPTRWALVVGIDEYRSKQISTLEGAVADARAVGAALVKYADVPDDHLELLVSDGAVKPTAGAIIDAVDRLRERVGPEDLLFFFFAGHGVEKDERRFLLTWETDVSTVGQLKTTSLPASILAQQLHLVKVRDQVTIIDACRDDPITREPNLVTRTLQEVFNFDASSDRRRWVTFLSASSGQRAWESKALKRGYFSFYFVRGLEGEGASTYGVTVNSLADYVGSTVSEAVSGVEDQQQTPMHYSGGPGPLVLVRPETLAVRPPPTAAARPTRRVYGSVVNADGSAVAGAVVRVQASGGGAPRTQTVNDEGFYTIAGVPADTDVDLEAEAPGYETAAVDPTRDELRKAVPIVLTRASAHVDELADAAYRSFLLEGFTRAEDLARAALKLAPEHARANAVLGNTLAFFAQTDRSKLPEARRAVERALARDAASALGRNASGVIAFINRDYSRAQRDFVEAVKRDPALATAHANLAETYIKRKKFREARQAAMDAIRLAPEIALPYNALAQAHVGLGEFRAAIDASRAAIARFRGSDEVRASLYLNLAVAQHHAKQWPEALEAIASAKRLGRKEDPWYQTIETAARRGGRRP